VQEAYPSELAYDFRSRFNLNAFEIGSQVSYLEAIHLVAVLLRDTTSWLNAAKADWKYPVSREFMVLASTFDLHMKVNSKQKTPKPYPTPWPDSNTQKLGSKKRQSPTAVKAKLELMNPKESNG